MAVWLHKRENRHYELTMCSVLGSNLFMFGSSPLDNPGGDGGHTVYMRKESLGA